MAKFGLGAEYDKVVVKKSVVQHDVFSDSADSVESSSTSTYMLLIIATHRL